MNTVGISSNALFGNSANNFFEPFSWCKTVISIRSSLLIRLPFCFCLCKNYVNADVTSILAGVSKHYACTIIGNVGGGNFRPCFYKKAISQQWTGLLSWNFTQTLQIDGFSWYKEKKWHSGITLFIKLFSHVQGAVFPVTVYILHEATAQCDLLTALSKYIYLFIYVFISVMNRASGRSWRKLWNPKVKSRSLEAMSVVFLIFNNIAWEKSSYIGRVRKLRQIVHSQTKSSSVRPIGFYKVKSDWASWAYCKVQPYIHDTCITVRYAYVILPYVNCTLIALDDENKLRKIKGLALDIAP